MMRGGTQGPASGATPATTPASTGAPSPGLPPLPRRQTMTAAAREAGYEVSVATRVQAHGDRIRQAGLRLIPLKVARRRVNPLREFGLLLSIWGVYRKERPSIVHQVAAKPILYGSLAARLAGVPAVAAAAARLRFAGAAGCSACSRWAEADRSPEAVPSIAPTPYGTHFDGSCSRWAATLPRRCVSSKPDGSIHIWRPSSRP